MNESFRALRVALTVGGLIGSSLFSGIALARGASIPVSIGWGLIGNAIGLLWVVLTMIGKNQGKEPS